MNYFNNYLIHFKGNIITSIILIVIMYGIFELTSLLYQTKNTISPIYMTLFSAIMIFYQMFNQISYSLNNKENFSIKDYDIKDDEFEICSDICKVFVYSHVVGKIVLTNKRLIFIPDAKFNNFYFDVDINKILDLSSDKRKQPALKLENGRSYNIFIKNHKKFYDEFNNLEKSKLKV